jgi:hypothetical protein
MELNNQHNDFDNVFLDVRRAYRLLYLYQRRVMDLMKFIGNQLSLRYAGGWSHYSSAAPKNGKGTLDNWAWDWLNMYQYEFNFASKVIDGKEIRFSVILVSDTAFFDAELDDECDLKAYPPAENTDTRIVLLAGKDAWHGEFADFWENYKKEAADYVRVNDKGTVVVRSIPLKQFINGSLAEQAILGYTALCAANGIPEVSAVTHR